MARASAMLSVASSHPRSVTTSNEDWLANDARAFPAEAQAAHQEILTIRTRVLGPDHPDTRKSAAALR